MNDIERMRGKLDRCLHVWKTSRDKVGYYEVCSKCDVPRAPVWNLKGAKSVFVDVTNEVMGAAHGGDATGPLQA